MLQLLQIELDKFLDIPFDQRVPSRFVPPGIHPLLVVLADANVGLRQSRTTAMTDDLGRNRAPPQRPHEPAKRPRVPCDSRLLHLPLENIRTEL